MRFLFTYLLLFGLTINTFAQLGGQRVYEFLAIPTSARSAALGGSALPLSSGEIDLISMNPSLLNADMHKDLAFTYLNYMGGINLGQVNYAHHNDKLGTFGLGVNYLNGGKFIEADENGFQYGTFGVNEIAIGLSYAKQLDSLFVIGATFKPIFSQLAQYNSFGIVMDVGATYTSRDKNFSGTLVFQNMGAQISSYADNYENVPFNIQLSVAKKLDHAPFRFLFTAHNLQKPNLTYTQSNYTEPGINNDESSTQETSFAQKFFTHIIVGVEFIPTKQFFVRAGYNHMRRHELALDSKPGTSGFSWGFGLKLAKFSLSYANARYHLAGASNHFTISSNLNNFIQ